MKQSREDLILSLKPCVEFWAQALCNRNGAACEELTACGWIGACQAVDNWDATKPANLRTFASRRIKGAMQDWFRSEDVLSRDERKKVQAGEKKAPKMLYLDGSHGYVKDSHKLTPRLEDHGNAVGAGIDAERALVELERKDATVLRMVFLEDRVLKKVGRRFGVGPERASQLKTEALKKCREWAASKRSQCSKFPGPSA